MGYRSGSEAPSSTDNRRKTVRTLTVAMMISSSVGGERSRSRSKMTPALKGPGTLWVRCMCIVSSHNISREVGGRASYKCRGPSISRCHTGGESWHGRQTSSLIYFVLWEIDDRNIGSVSSPTEQQRRSLVVSYTVLSALCSRTDIAMPVLLARVLLAVSSRIVPRPDRNSLFVDAAPGSTHARWCRVE